MPDHRFGKTIEVPKITVEDEIIKVPKLSQTAIDTPVRTKC